MPVLSRQPGLGEALFAGGRDVRRAAGFRSFEEGGKVLPLQVRIVDVVRRAQDQAGTAQRLDTLSDFSSYLVGSGEAERGLAPYRTS